MRKLHLINTNRPKEQPAWPVQSVTSTTCGNASLQLKQKLETHRFSSARTSLHHNSSVVVAESNNLLRGKLKEAEESVTFMVGKLKLLEKELSLVKSTSQDKDEIIRELGVKLESLTKKYRRLRKSEMVEEVLEEKLCAKHQPTEEGGYESICQKYWEELRTSDNVISKLKADNDRLKEQNAQMSVMLQAAKQELYRLSEVMTNTHSKLEDIAKVTNGKCDQQHSTVCTHCHTLFQPTNTRVRQVAIFQESHQQSPNFSHQRTDMLPPKPILKKHSNKQQTPPTMLPHSQSNSLANSNISESSINNLLQQWKSAANDALQNTPDDFSA